MSITIYQAPLYGKISVVAAWSRHEQNMRWNRAIKIQGAIERQKAHVVTVEIARVGGHYAFRGHSRSLILEPIETCVRLIVQLGLYSIILSKLLVMNLKKNYRTCARITNWRKRLRSTVGWLLNTPSLQAPNAMQAIFIDIGNKKLISRWDSERELFSCARKRLCWNAGLPNSVK